MVCLISGLCSFVEMAKLLFNEFLNTAAFLWLFQWPHSYTWCFSSGVYQGRDEENYFYHRAHKVLNVVITSQYDYSS